MSDPLRPTGSDPESIFAQRTHDNVFGPGQKLRNSRTAKISRSPGGVFIKVRVTPSASVAPSIACQPFRFIQSFGDYFLATSTSGTVVQIAKPYKLRNSIAFEVIYGNRINFSYPHNVANDPLAYIYRHAFLPADPSQFENQGIVPQYLAASANPVKVADLIYAIQPTGGTGVVSGVDGTAIPAGTAIVWEDLNCDGRAWTRFGDQSFGA